MSLYIAAITISGMSTAVTNYGDLGFGLFAVCTLVGLIVLIWTKVIKPAMEVLLKISENNTKTTENLKDTATTLERTLIETKGMTKIQADIVTRLERLEHPEPDEKN